MVTMAQADRAKPDDIALVLPLPGDALGELVVARRVLLRVELAVPGISFPAAAGGGLAQQATVTSALRRDRGSC